MNSKVGEMRKGFLKIISPDNSVCPVVPSIVRPASISSQFSMTLFSTANVPPKLARSCDGHSPAGPIFNTRHDTLAPKTTVSHSCRFRKVRFVHIDGVARRGSGEQQCLRTARSHACRAHPSRLKTQIIGTEDLCLQSGRMRDRKSTRL